MVTPGRSPATTGTIVSIEAVAGTATTEHRKFAPLQRLPASRAFPRASTRIASRIMDYQTLSGRARAAFTYRTRRPRDAALRKLLWLTFPPARGRRFRAHLDNVHSEWTIIHSGQHDVSTTSPELLGLLLRAAEAAQTVELSDISDRAGQTEEKLNVGRWPGEHYRLLRALAQVWNARSIAEIGTSTGVSALTFARTEGVERVVTFDIHGWT